MCEPIYQDEVKDQIEMVSKARPTELNSFRIIFPAEDGGVGERMVFQNEPCFYKLNRFGKGSLFIVSSILNTDFTDQRSLVYLKYVMEESPFKSVFMNTLEEVVRDSTVVVTSEAPSNLMVGGLVCTRYLWEFPYYIRLFNDLVENGVEKGIAFLFIHFFQYSVAPDRSRLLTLRYNAGGHEAINPLPEDFGYCKNFLEGTPKYLNSPFHKWGNYSTPHTINSIWRPKEIPQDSLGEFLCDVWRDALSPKTSNTPCLNPFKRALKNNSPLPSGPYEDVIKLCVEHLVPAFKEKISNDKL